MKPLGEILKDRNIVLATNDPVEQGGFSMVPNFILKDPTLSLGAKVTYSMFLVYAWQNDYCFPGQETLAQDMGMSRSRVTEFVGQLQKAGLITIERRGLGRTNMYTLNFPVKVNVRRPRVGRPTSGSRRIHANSQRADFLL